MKSIEQKRINDKLDFLLHMPVSEMTGDQIGHLLQAVNVGYLKWPIPDTKLDERDLLLRKASAALKDASLLARCQESPHERKHEEAQWSNLASRIEALITGKRIQ